MSIEIKNLNAQPGSREFLEAKHGQVWDNAELSEDFDVIGFKAPVEVVQTDGQKGSLQHSPRFYYDFVLVVRRKSDGKEGSLFFQHSPRFYYGFDPHKK